MKIETQFNVGEKVWLKELRVPARVVSIICSAEDGLQYRCRWFDGKKSETDYFFLDEVGTLPENEAIGFQAKEQA